MNDVLRSGDEQIAAMDELDDNDLVGRAKLGEQEAFGELVRRHRAKVYGYAQSITQESFLAEDIVQEALMRAFLHLGSLVDTERFLPWLTRIVRNQAYSKLKSKPVLSEQSFAALQQVVSDQEDWRDLDYIVRRLSRSEVMAGQEADPQERFVRKEFLDMIGGMLRCLNHRERQIFESHFFDHLSPQEIARLFQLSSANVYQILSRSRKKVMQEKIRVVVDDYVKNRKEMGRMKHVVLPRTDAFQQSCSWTSAASAIYCLLSYTDKKYSVPAVMGYTGLAFRLSICSEDVHIAGPTSFNFKNILTRGLANLGFHSRTVARLSTTPGENANLVDPYLLTAEAKEKRKLNEALPEALNLIHSSIDRGLPVVSWDLYIPEFGIIYGYDDMKRELFPSECGKNDPLPYEHLGRGYLEDLFILAVEDPNGRSERDRLSGALRMILDHYYAKEEPSPRTVHGLHAYDTWIEAFRGGQIEPNGNAYNTVVVQDARHHAAAFLQELANTWQGESASDDRIRQISGETSKLYTDIAGQLKAMRSMFPFPAGGEPNNPVQAEKSIRILQSVKGLERQAVDLLETMYAELMQHNRI